MRRLIEPVALPLLRFATRSYIPGPELSDAMELAAVAAARGLDITIGYWNDGKEDPRRVADLYLATLDAIAAAGPGGCVAVKIPSLLDSIELSAEIAARARALGVRIVFDSHAPAQTDTTFRVLEAIGAEGVGMAIPGRWRRSAEDADRAVALGVDIRVVKGQWPDPDDPRRDMREGFLSIVERIAGKARHVGVATHDAPLARDSFARLGDAKTPCEQELVYPLPVGPALSEARAAGLKSRLYIPFGSAWLPYSVSRALQNPRIVLWLLRDLATNRRFSLPEAEDAARP